MEQTNPQGGVTETPSDFDKVLNYLNQPGVDDGQDEGSDPPQELAQAPVAQTTEQPDGQAESSELTADDLLDEGVEAQPTVEGEFEIVHDGQQRKLTREEAIKYAQQGFDYTVKTQRVAEKEKAVERRLAMLSEVEQVQPVLANDLAQVKAIEAQLNQYRNVDWVKLATDDPLEYPKHRAQYDNLVQSWNMADAAYQQKREAVNQHVSAIKAQMLQEEARKLPELIPEWRNQDLATKEKAEVLQYLLDQGASPELVGQRVSDALSVSIAYKAWRFDQLRKSKAEKVGQLKPLPPVQKPGAPVSRDQAKADQTRKLQDRLRKSGSTRDAAALLLTRM